MIFLTYADLGRVTVKVLPFWGVLSTVMEPLHRVMARLAMVRPMP